MLNGAIIALSLVLNVLIYVIRDPQTKKRRIFESVVFWIAFVWGVFLIIMQITGASNNELSSMLVNTNIFITIGILVLIIIRFFFP